MRHLLAILFYLGFAPPHGDLDLRIAEVTEFIRTHPDSVQLYMIRGELYLQHEEFKPALSDFYHCVHHGLLNSRVCLGLSKSLWNSDAQDSSLYFVNKALDFESSHPAALEWKGYILHQLDQSCESAAIYTLLISKTSQPSPSLFIDAANSIVDCKSPDAESKAVQIIRDGMARIGSLHVLEKKLVEIYLHYNSYEMALQVQEEIINHWTFKAKPYYDRAEIYLMLGKKSEAIEDLNQALTIMDSLPLHKANLPAMKDLKNQILSKLNSLKS